MTSSRKKKRPRAAETGEGGGATATAEGWSREFPYEVDYCDHFETPKRAYEDICPILRRICGKNKRVCLYDPYYCNGRTKVLLNELGFENVVHRCRDFYADMRQENIPPFDVLITNPPYSEKHKTKCLEFAFDSLRTKGRPFFLLMPNYIATREYFRAFVRDQTKHHQVLYFCPPQSYQYDHPEGTGHVSSPFQSIWYIGVGNDRYKELKKRRDEAIDTLFSCLYFSLDELKQGNLVPTLKRPNPRQRNKRRKRDATIEPRATAGSTEPAPLPPEVTQGKKRRKSKHRNDQGVRTRKRF